MKTKNIRKPLIISALFCLVASSCKAQGQVNLRGVDALISSSYIFAIIFMGVAILLAVLVSNIIKFEGGSNPKDEKKRRIWFWIFAILGPVSFFLFNVLSVIPSIRKGPAVSKFGSTHIIASAIILVGYVVIGFILAKVMKNGKLGNWFPSKN
jgi:hypothetical protein